jgi:hypothetical protein
MHTMAREETNEWDGQRPTTLKLAIISCILDPDRPRCLRDDSAPQDTWAAISPYDRTMATVVPLLEYPDTELP